MLAQPPSICARSKSRRLAVDGNLVGERARDANHDVVNAFVISEHQVAVIDLAGGELGAASAAGAGLA